MIKNKARIVDTLLASVTCSIFSTIITFIFYYRFQLQEPLSFFARFIVFTFTITLVSVFIPLLFYNSFISPRFISKFSKINGKK